ncbi:GGDEF domain-containing protein [Anaerotignum neopropionicum]|nr:GGDEF domain-containing protein [Anaerotignum neopropionicum]
MISFLYLQVNIVGMIIIFIILANQQNIDDGTGRQKAFIYLIYSVFTIQFFDSVMWLIDGKQFLYAKTINWAVSGCCYFLNCFVAFIWFIYISLLFYDKKIINKKFWAIIGIPLLVNMVLVILNFKYKIFFYIDENNVYARGPFFFISFLLALPYFLIPFYYCFKIYRTSESILEKKDCAIIMRTYFLPVIGIVFQMFFYGLSLIWICVVLSLLIIFINFQNRRISTDPLTQLNNRYQFDMYLQNIRHGITKGQPYSILIIDVDKFKEVNDTYGHVFGDRVLIETALILRRACQGTGAMIGRYGGDEFYIICKAGVKKEITKGIHQFVEVFNAADSVGVGLSLSIGSSDFLAEESFSKECIVERADKEMYKNKIK